MQTHRQDVAVQEFLKDENRLTIRRYPASDNGEINAVNITWNPSKNRHRNMFRQLGEKEAVTKASI